MNKLEGDIILTLLSNNRCNQRYIAQKLGISLGHVNNGIKELAKKGYLISGNQFTKIAKNELEKNKPRNAIILAAGYGMRMVPINTEVPKGLLEVKGEPLVERTIKQLHEVGINDIKIVVGFKKEQYEYLIDEFGVELIVNNEYKEKNNLSSLNLVRNFIYNTYIIPCDIYCKSNPYKENEIYSWYMVSDEKDEESNVRINKKMTITKTEKNQVGNKMIGISYICNSDGKKISERIRDLSSKKEYNESFWEEVLFENNKMIIYPNIASKNDVVEINTYEELRDFDNKSNNLDSDAINIIKNVFNVDDSDIKNITILKKGMTNRSFQFECLDEKYIMRIPGEGTESLINRKEEFEVYNKIKSIGICDDIYYINPKSGYKITKFIENTRVCNSGNQNDLKNCMKRLREFHNMKLKVNHEFDIFKQIKFYKSLWNGNKSVYRDYEETEKNIFALKKYIEENVQEKCLTHIDAVSDNFLIYNDKNGNEQVRLIDWEYSGMQDPHVDIAMFCIYALYDKEQVDNLINIYFEGKCPNNIRLKIYCYIATCGLLWSNWCEYKRNLGVDFGEYSLRQYRYAKDYYRIVKKELNPGDNNE